MFRILRRVAFTAFLPWGVPNTQFFYLSWFSSNLHYLYVGKMFCISQLTVFHINLPYYMVIAAIFQKIINGDEIDGNKIFRRVLIRKI